VCLLFISFVNNRAGSYASHSELEYTFTRLFEKFADGVGRGCDLHGTYAVRVGPSDNRLWACSSSVRGLHVWVPGQRKVFLLLIILA
jgi:hypothetical protein